MTRIERTKDSFPHPTIDTIVGQPSYETINPLHQKINANVASVVSHIVNGCLGLLYLTVTSVVFLTLCPADFVQPVNPGLSPEYPPGETQFQVHAVTALHDQATKDFKQYSVTDCALKQQLLGSIDDMFVNILLDNHVSYANVTTLQLLIHLYNTYANITNGVLEDNKDAMAAPYNVNLPMETLYKCIEESVQYAAAENTPFTAAQVVSTAFRIIQKNRMFVVGCKAWTRRPAIEKTWAQLTIDFSTAHNELRESQHTSHASDFHGNSVEIIQQEAATTMSNLVNATLANRKMMIAMQATITTLNTQLAKANTQLMKNENVMATLKTKVAAYKDNGGCRGEGNSGCEEGGRGAGSDAVITFTQYC